MNTKLVTLTKTVLQSTRHVSRLVCLALLALLALVAPQASAAIAVVDTLPTANTTPANNYTVTFSQSGSGANLLAVNLNYRKSTADALPVGPTNVSWVTSGSTVTQSLTLAVSQWSGSSGANNRGHQIWYLNNPLPDAAGVITVTYTNTGGTQARQVLTAYMLSGVDTNLAPIIAFSATNVSTLTHATTNALGTVPLGGFAVLNSTIDGSTSLESPTVNTIFAAKPAGSGATVSTTILSFAGGSGPNYGASTWVQGYIPALVSTVTNISIVYNSTSYAPSGGKGAIVGAIFTAAASASPIPDLIASSATTITNTSAALGALVITNGGSAITNYGIVYAQTSLNSNPQIGGASVIQLVKGTTDTLGAFSTNATGLTPATQYSYAGYAQNVNGIGYSPVGTFYSLANEPTVQATAASIVNAQRSYFTINWTRGNGANCIVVVRAGSAVNAAPVDGVTYTTGVNWNSGSQIGSGNYAAYVGTGNTVTLAGVTVGTIYHVAVYEVNGTGGPENYLTTVPATAASSPVVPNTYYSDYPTSTLPTVTGSWWTGTGGTGNNPVNFTGGDIFIIQSGDIYTGGGVNWTVSGGAQLIINSGGTLDMTTDKLNLGGSFVNNGTFLATGATAPIVNFTSSGNITLSTNYDASVLSIGGGGGGAGGSGSAGAGGGGGGGASAYSTNLVLQAANVYTITVGASGARGTSGNNGSAGGLSSFGGGFLVPITANGGSGGQAWTGVGGAGGVGGVAGVTGNAVNFAGGNATGGVGGGGGGGGADDAAVGNAASGGTGGSAGSGTVAQGGAGASIQPGLAGLVGSAPGGGGSGGDYSGTGSGQNGQVGGAGQVSVVLIGTNTSPSALTYDYRSRASGNWGDFNTWSVNKGSGFVNALSGETPNSGHNSVEIMSSHTVTVAAAAIAVNLKVNTGGVLTVSGAALAVNRVPGQTVANNMTVEGTLNLALANALALGNNSTNLIASGGVLNHTGAATVVSYGSGAKLTINGTYVQNITGSGVIPVATWAAASTCRIDSTFTNSITTGTAPFPQLNYMQSYGNFIWNARGDTTNGLHFMTASDASITNWVLQGALTIENSAGIRSRLHFANTALVLATNKGFFMSGGNFGIANSASHMTVDGPIALGGGQFSSSGVAGATLTALGDVSFTNTVAVSGGGLAVNFAKAGAQNWTVTTSSNDLSGPSWTVDSGSAVTYGNASYCIINDLTVNGSLAITGNSTLLVTGGAIPSTNNAGTITVASGSTLGGDGAIGAGITLAVGAFATNTVSFDTNNTSNGELTVTNGLALNGNTFRVSTGTNVLGVGDYLLITNTSAGITGTFGSVVISGAGLGTNSGSVITTPNTVTLKVVAAAVPAQPPVITSTTKSGNAIIVSGTNTTGTAGGTYYVRAFTNVTSSVTNWPRISTNTYGVGGVFSVTNQVNPAIRANFFRIEQ